MTDKKIHLDITKAPFEEILALQGVGEATMLTMMKDVGRWDEYQEWLAPMPVWVGDQEVEVSRTEIKSYANLTAVMKKLGFDPDDARYSGITRKERSMSARHAFEEARRKGKVSDDDIAQVVAEMKLRKMVQDEEKVEQVFEETVGIRREGLQEIQERIQKQYSDLLRSWSATTSDAHQQLLHVANLFVNRKMLQDTYTKINSGATSIDQISKNARAMGELSTQIQRMTNEINSILSGFKKQDEMLGGPREMLTEMMARTKEIQEVFGQPIECPKCHKRYGVIIKLASNDMATFPVIDFYCKAPDGATKKECGGHVYVDIDGKIESNDLVKFVDQEFFDPDRVGRNLLDREAMS